MASGDILVAFRKLYRKAGEEVELFRKNEAQLNSVLRTVSNVVLRVPVLEQAENLGDLGMEHGVGAKLMTAQMLALHELLVQLRAALSAVQENVTALGRLAADANRLVQQNRALTPAARAREAGPVPSVNACVAGLQELWESHKKQEILLAAIVDEASPDTIAEDWPHFLAAASASLCLDRRRLGNLLYVMEQTEEKRRL